MTTKLTAEQARERAELGRMLLVAMVMDPRVRQTIQNLVECGDQLADALEALEVERQSSAEAHRALVVAREQAESSLKEAMAINTILHDALRHAKEVIKTWHNMGGADDVWDIYDKHAPEMKKINAAINSASSA